MGRSGVWELNPILQEVVVYPVNKLVHTFASAFVGPVSRSFFSSIEDTLNDPIVSLNTENFAPES